MSDKTEWFHGVLEAEFWTIYRGWRVFVRKSSFGGFAWSIQREGRSCGDFALNRTDAENAAIAAVDQMEP